MIISVNGQPLINQVLLPVGVSHIDHVRNVLSNTALRRTVRFMRCAPGCVDSALNTIIVRVSPEEAALFFDAGETNDNSHGWIVHGSTSISDSFSPPVQESIPTVFPGARNIAIREEESIHAYQLDLNGHNMRDVQSANRWTEEMQRSEGMDDAYIIEQEVKRQLGQVVDRHEHHRQSSSSSIDAYHHKYQHNQIQQQEEKGDYMHRLAAEEQQLNEIRRSMEEQSNRRLDDERRELQRLKERRRAEEERLEEQRRTRAALDEETAQSLRVNREYEMMEYHRRALTMAPPLPAANMGISAPGHYMTYAKDPYVMPQISHTPTLVNQTDYIEELVNQRVAAEVEQRMRVELELSKATAELG